MDVKKVIKRKNEAIAAKHDGVEFRVSSRCVGQALCVYPNEKLESDSMWPFNPQSVGS